MLLPARRFVPFVLALLVAACGGASDEPATSPDPDADALAAGGDDVEGTSLLGEPLRRPPIADAARERMESQLADARAAWEADPSVDTAIWLGRRTAYLGSYRDAIAIYTKAIAGDPDDPRLYRHRGHRYLSVRDIDAAVADFERAVELTEGQPDEVEPDGQPNARNIPTSTLHSNIWYHLALARYVRGDFEAAAEAWRNARAAVDNPDNLVASSYWLYLSLMRAGRADEAQAVLEPITPELDVIENGSYHALLLLFRGDRTEEAVLGDAGEGAGGAAVRYGVGAWHFVQGREARAREIWNDILTGTDWPSFGYLAAEAEAARVRGT